MGRMCTAQWTRRPGASGRLIVLVLAIEKFLLALASESITDKKKKTILKNIFKKKKFINLHCQSNSFLFLFFFFFFFFFSSSQTSSLDFSPHPLCFSLYLRALMLL